MQARHLLRDVRTILSDTSSERWPLDELVTWLNRGLREIAIKKPTAYNRNLVIGLAEGSYQPLPANVTQIVRVIRNVGGLGEPRQGRSAITTVPREIMDAQHEDWHNPNQWPPQKRVEHVIFDPLDQRSFYVWPPNNGTGRIEVVATKLPADVPIGNPKNALSSYAVEIDIDEVYTNALTDYVLYRAYSKDAGFAGNAQRAAGHYTAFAESLGIKVSNEVLMNPNTTRQSA